MDTTLPAVTAYSPMQKRLHWAVVILLALQYLFFDGMGRPFHQLMEGQDAWTTTVVIHLAIGVLVLLAALWRLSLRRSHGVPEEPEGTPARAKLASKAVHYGIYALLVILPISGSVAWFGKIGTPAQVHEILTNVLLALVGIHVLAALVHQFVWKDNLLLRMK
ncbi:cytochrome b [Donghicola sp. C2-DW-16]|uniref:Cytochrome b n=1 Tax=Donghicola mangrovi TaxID=2729614 RepID=A0ABX2PFB5_9RHOB|nr:cytochrome b/b6 domain-containing protein [Donghicola mangrovi]NVO27482.1 cytochrome b [Donghicola mangrovi]